MSEINSAFGENIISSSNRSSVNSPKLKRFVRHMLYAAKKLDKLNSAKSELQKKLDDLKALSKNSSRNIKDNIDNHLNELMSKVDLLIDSEKSIAVKSPGINTKTDSELIGQINFLKSEVERLHDENKNIQALTRTIQELESKLEENESKKNEREDRMEELEKKIKDKVEKSFSEIEAIENKLSFMSSKYEELLSSGKHSEDDLKIIKQRIDDLRSVLTEKKSYQIPR